jgi:hypothetical protein
MAHKLYLIVESEQALGGPVFQCVTVDEKHNHLELTKYLNENFNTNEAIDKLLEGTIKSFNPLTIGAKRVDRFKTLNEAFEMGMTIQYYIVRHNDGNGWVPYKGKGWLVENIKRVEG